MTPEVRRELSADAVSPAQARSIVRRMLDVWDADDVKVVELLTSELVTNAVRHAATEIVLRVEAEASTVRVEVTDRDAHLPSMRDDVGIGGYGLRIVDRLATRWGVDQVPDTGKTVWFELELTGHEGETAGATR
jgi:anti-sigma regulatory factor (Ser/Thr protein kinase)